MAKVVVAVILLGLVVSGYFLTTGAGKPVKTDLSVIGNGRPALVLAYENFSLAGGDALNRLRQVRSDYDSRLEFVVADLGTPQGSDFANRYQLIDGLAVIMASDGQLLQTTNIPADEGELRDFLDSVVEAVE